MWHQVLVVDHSEDIVQLALHELRQVRVADSWLTKVVHLHFVLAAISHLDLQS